MQRKIDAIPGELGDIVYDRVDVARRDEHALGACVLHKRTGVHDGRHAECEHGHRQRFAVEGGPVVADAGTGGDAGVGKLQAIRQIAKKIEDSTGKSVNVTDVRLLLFNPIDLRGIPTSYADKTFAV